jgi:CoA-binding domain
LTPVWVGLCGVTLLFVLLVRAIADMCREEVKTRLIRLPNALLRVVALRIPRESRADILDEWRAELDHILRDTDGLPVTRLLKGMHFSVSLLRTMLPSSKVGDLTGKFMKRRRGRLNSPYAAKVLAQPSVITWTGRYLRQALVIDGAVALAAGLLALRGRLDHHGHVPAGYVALTFGLPFAWIACVALARGYEARFIGTGVDEFRRIINAGIALTGAVAILSYATTARVARGYIVVAMPCLVALDLVARYWLRKRLHRLRAQGGCMRRAVAVGHPKDVESLINELRRGPAHGLSVVAVCLVGNNGVRDFVQGVPVHGGLDDVISAVWQ